LWQYTNISEGISASTFTARSSETMVSVHITTRRGKPKYLDLYYSNMCRKHSAMTSDKVRSINASYFKFKINVVQSSLVHYWLKEYATIQRPAHRAQQYCAPHQDVFQWCDSNRFTVKHRSFQWLHLSFLTDRFGVASLGHSMTRVIRLLLTRVIHSVRWFPLAAAECRYVTQREKCYM